MKQEWATVDAYMLVFRTCTNLGVVERKVLLSSELHALKYQLNGGLKISKDAWKLLAITI